MSALLSGCFLLRTRCEWWSARFCVQKKGKKGERAGRGRGAAEEEGRERRYAVLCAFSGRAHVAPFHSNRSKSQLANSHKAMSILQFVLSVNRLNSMFWKKFVKVRRNKICCLFKNGEASLLLGFEGQGNPTQRREKAASLKRRIYVQDEVGPPAGGAERGPSWRGDRRLWSLVVRSPLVGRLPLQKGAQSGECS